MIDIHCHILPGIDDGPKDLDESIAMLRMAEADGVRSIVATPHSGGAYEEPDSDHIRELVRTVNAAAADEGIAVELLPGCEAQITPDFAEKVASGRIITLGDLGRYVLMEVSATPLPAYGLDGVFNLALAGVIPVLAHGERLAGTKSGMAFVSAFARQGGLVQLNADAVGGLVGRQVQRCCGQLWRRGCAHVIASDGHGTRRRPPLLSPCLAGFKRRARLTALQDYCSVELSAASHGVGLMQAE